MLFRVELIVSSFLDLISNWSETDTAVRAFLFIQNCNWKAAKIIVIVYGRGAL